MKRRAEASSSINRLTSCLEVPATSFGGVRLQADGVSTQRPLEEVLVDFGERLRAIGVGLPYAKHSAQS